MSYKEKAEALFKSGRNCAQAVFGAFCTDFGIDDETGLKLSSAFGGGLSRQREVCGAVSGMCMAAGLIYSPSDPNDHAAKSAHYERVQKLCDAFRAENGSIICRELLGLEKPEGTHVPEKRTEEYYKKRPCAELCACAAELLEKYMAENPIE